MGTFSVSNMLTPGQKRAKEQRERDAFIRTKFKIENNPNPQFFNGSITRGFVMRDGSIYVEFTQYHTRYQLIITEAMIAIYGYAKLILEQFKAGKRFSITVKGVCGWVNDKGVRNIKQVSFLK